MRECRWCSQPVREVIQVDPFTDREIARWVHSDTNLVQCAQCEASPKPPEPRERNWADVAWWALTVVLFVAFLALWLWALSDA